MPRDRLVRLALVALVAIAAPGVAQAGRAPARTAPTTTAAPASEPSAPAGEPAIAPSEPDAAEPPPTDPEPVATEPTTEPVASVDAAAVARLQDEAKSLRDALFKARARVSIVASKLFSTRIALQLRTNLERFYTASNLTIRIDGAPVYVQERGMPTTAEDLFEVYAAPGSHELAVSVDLVARRDPAHKIRIDQAISFAVADDTRVSSRLLLRETGNMWRFASKGRGHSDVRVSLRAKAKGPRRRGGSAKPAAKGGTP